MNAISRYHVQIDYKNFKSCDDRSDLRSQNSYRKIAEKTIRIQNLLEKQVYNQTIQLLHDITYSTTKQ